MQFQVTVPAAKEICISELLGEQADATVRITCSTNRFVRIEGNPHQGFLGPHGSSLRYSIGSGFATASHFNFRRGIAGARGTSVPHPNTSVRKDDNGAEVVLVSF